MTQITFGKFQGWEPLNLAKAGEAGRNYLFWGAENLKSPKWQAEFKAALAASVQPDADLMARAMLVGDSGLNYDEALVLAQDEIIQDAETEAMIAEVDARLETVIARWLPRMPGKTAEQIRAIGQRYQFQGRDLDQLPASRFSSIQAKQDFLTFMQEWDACWD